MFCQFQKKGLAVILKRMNKPEVTIAVDGSLFRYHPRLQMIMEETLRSLINPSNKVNSNSSIKTNFSSN
jgi:hypothetical protein